VTTSTRQTLKCLLVPGGVVLFAVALVVQTPLLAISSSTADFFNYGACLIALLLALRFRSSRIVFTVVTLYLAQRTLLFFSSSHPAAAGPGRIALEAIALLVPVNFLLATLMDEHGLSWAAAAPRLTVLFLESVFVAVICRPGEVRSPALLRLSLLDGHWFHWTRIPQLALLCFALVVGVLLTRLIRFRRPLENGFLWSAVAAFAALQLNGIGVAATTYWGTAALMLAIAIIENSYSLAYHDELTALPSRRAFNEDLLGLQQPYAIATVDIDHFKSFNDTYGHDTGDEVLRMVASRLAQVTGGGKAFRVGGEEFSIVFPGRQLKDVVPHLEHVRAVVEQSAFRVRGGQERRQAERGPDRRTPPRRRSSRLSARSDSDEISVTISIGVAETNTRLTSPEQVMAAADKALYRAKRAGRNRVETASARPRSSRLKRSIA